MLFDQKLFVCIYQCECGVNLTGGGVEHVLVPQELQQKTTTEALAFLKSAVYCPVRLPIAGCIVALCTSADLGSNPLPTVAMFHN